MLRRDVGLEVASMDVSPLAMRAAIGSSQHMVHPSQQGCFALGCGVGIRITTAIDPPTFGWGLRIGWLCLVDAPVPCEQVLVGKRCVALVALERPQVPMDRVDVCLEGIFLSTSISSHITPRQWLPLLLGCIAWHSSDVDSQT